MSIMKNVPYNLLFVLIIGCASTGRYYENGHRAFVKGDYEEAIKKYNQFLQTDPKDERRIKAEVEIGQAYFNLGKVYYEKKDYKFAEKLFYSSNTIEGDKWITKCKLSIAEEYYNIANYEQAIEELNLAAEESSDSVTYLKVLHLKVKVLFELKELTECVKTYNELRKYQNAPIVELQEIIQGVAVLCIRKGDKLLEKGEINEAIRTYSLLDGISNIYEAVIKRKLEDSKFKLLVAKGDQAMKEEKWIDARKFYFQSLKYNSGDRDVISKLNSVSDKIGLGTTELFEKGLLVSQIGYTRCGAHWLNENQYGRKFTGNFARCYKSPEERITILLFCENELQNSPVIAFAFLIVPEYHSVFADLVDLMGFLIDVTGLGISIEDASNFVMNCIIEDKEQTKKFGIFNITVTRMPSMLLYMVIIS